MTPSSPAGDIHNYESKYRKQVEGVKSSKSLSTSNKKLILAFDRTCHLEGLSLPRRIKLINSLHTLSNLYLQKDFASCLKSDLQDAVLKIDSRRDCSPWTKQSYRAVIKKFFSWLEYGDEYKHEIRAEGYPKLVRWINTNLSKKLQPKVQASELLTEEEIQALIKVAEHPRDRAFVGMLYELGARIGELGSLEIRNVTKDQYGYLVDLDGKTGRRTPRIVLSAPYLTSWMNAHPKHGDPRAPLWLLKGQRGQLRKMRYSALRVLIHRLAKRAAITKRIYPHLFRHTRVTHLLIKRQISEAQAKVYFGWAPSSRMLADYSHLVSSDVNDSILEMYGIKPAEGQSETLKPKQCPMCETINTPEAMFCNKCAGALDVKAAIALDEKRKRYDDLISDFMSDPEVKMLFARKVEERGLSGRLNEAERRR